MIQKEKQYTDLKAGHEPSYSPHLQGDTDFFNLIKPLTTEEQILFTLKYIYEYQTDEIADISFFSLALYIYLSSGDFILSSLSINSAFIISMEIGTSSIFWRRLLAETTRPLSSWMSDFRNTVSFFFPL